MNWPYKLALRGSLQKKYTHYFIYISQVFVFVPAANGSNLVLEKEKLLSYKLVIAFSESD